MSYTEQELRAKWSESRAMPAGAAKFAAIDEVLRHADALGLEEFAFDVRMTAMSIFHHGGQPVRTFLAFSWCLAAFDREPARYGRAEGSLRWRFKWVVWALPQFPEIPLERTYAVLDDMERRYLSSGQSLHAVYQHRWLVAHHVGDEEAAERWFAALRTARRDGNSDCATCVPSSIVRHLSTTGRFKEAVEVGKPVQRGGCSEQPQWINSELLIPFLRTERLDEAAEAHSLAYRRIRNDPHHLDNLAQNVLFCGISGNERKGLELIERHLPWFDAPSSPFAALEFATASVNVLQRLGEQGHDEEPALESAGQGNARGGMTIAALRKQLRERAVEIAAGFDVRNGNDYQSRRAAERMQLAPTGPRVALTILDGRRIDGQSTGTVSRLVAEIGRLTEYGDPTAAALTRRQLFDVLADAKRWADAAEVGEEAMRELMRTGQEEPADACRYRLSQVYRLTGQPQQAQALLVEVIARGGRFPESPGLAALHAEAAGSAQPAERIGHLRTAARLYGEDSDRPNQVRMLTSALDHAASTGRLELAHDILAEADALIAESEGWADELVRRRRNRELDFAASRLFQRAKQSELSITRLRSVLAAIPTPENRDARDRTDFANAQRALVEPLINTGRLEEAETAARAEFEAAPNGYARRNAASRLAKVLDAQGRKEEALHLANEHNVQPPDPEDDEGQEDS